MRYFVIILFALVYSCAAAKAGEVADYMASDANKDGLLQKSEFQAFIKRRAKAGDKSAKLVVTFAAWGRALKMVDTNGDKIVSPAELRAFDAKN